MLYTKQIDQILFKDTQDFCSTQIHENLYLDYKEDINSSIHKTIAAMANTVGGLIVVGVADNDGLPTIPAEGIPAREGVREQINNIILSNITPPIFPEIQVCKSDDGTKMLAVIRIAQSNMTPHAVMGNTRVYIRTQTGNQPTEDLAALDRIEWLKDRRKKSSELLERINRESDERYSTLCAKNKVNLNESQIRLSVSPLYPREILIDPRKISEVGGKIVTHGYDRSQIPYFHGNIYHNPFSIGAYNFTSNEGNNAKVYDEINQYGFMAHKQDFIYPEREYEGRKNVKLGLLWHVLLRVDLFLEASAKFYNEIGYWGLVQFRFSLDKLSGTEILNLPAPAGKYYIHNEPMTPIDDTYSVVMECTVSELKDKRVELVTGIVSKAAWALGFRGVSESQVKTCMAEHHRA